MEKYFGDVLNWSALNLMNINITSKTKEMIVGANVLMRVCFLKLATVAVIFK